MTRSLHLLILFGVVLALTIAFIYSATRRTLPPGSGIGEADGPPLLPALVERIDQVSRLELTAGDARATLVRLGEADWADADTGYPLNAEAVNAILLGLVRLDAGTPRTKNPANFDELGVDWPDAAGDTRRVRAFAGDAGQTRRVRAFVGDAAEPLADVLLGEEVWTPDQTYVRRFGEDQVYRVSRHVPFAADLTEWMATDAPQVPAVAIASARLGGVAVMATQAGQWEASAVDERSAVDDARLSAVRDRLPTLLSAVRFDAVEPFPDDAPTPEATIDYALKDGAAVTATLFRRGEGDDARWWVRLRETTPATPSDDAEAAEALGPSAAHRLARGGAWWYRLPEWQSSAIANLVNTAPPAESPEAAQAPEAPEAPETPAARDVSDVPASATP